jgi:hypothetical protein
MSMSDHAYTTGSPQPSPSLIAYNKLDGLCYESRQMGWVPIGALDADGLISPIDTSFYPTIPVSHIPEDLFVAFDQLSLRACPAPSLANTDTHCSSLSSPYPSLQEYDSVKKTNAPINHLYSASHWILF